MKKLLKITGKYALAAAVWGCLAQVPQNGPEASASEVQSLLAKSCASCHSGAQPAGGLRLDSLAGGAQGGKSGAVILPGNAAASLLFQRVNTPDRALRMPLGGTPLASEQIALLRNWIDGGA